jgi:hypothetical protein
MSRSSYDVDFRALIEQLNAAGEACGSQMALGRQLYVWEDVAGLEIVRARAS